MATDPNAPGHHPHEPPPREREVIVTDSGGRGGGIGGVIVAIIAIIVLVVIGLVVVNAIQGGVEDVEEGPNVEVPSDINVDVDDENGGGDGG